MKKVLAICLTLLLVLSMSVSAFAAGSFVKSPSTNKAPKLVSFETATAGCTAQLVITPYAERNTLDAAAKTKIEGAYAQIAGAADLSTLNAKLATLVKDTKGLAVSDLFDASINCTSSTAHEHTNVHVVLEADTLDKFVALLHLNANGAWEVVEGAKVTGNQLDFTVASLSPFAIVVSTTADNILTGDALIITCAAAMAVCAAGVAVILVKRKKEQA